MLFLFFSGASCFFVGKGKAGTKLCSSINLCREGKNINYLCASWLTFELIFSKLSFFLSLWYFHRWAFSFKKLNKICFKTFPVFSFSRKFSTFVAFAWVSYFAFWTVKLLNGVPEAQTLRVIRKLLHFSKIAYLFPYQKTYPSAQNCI